MFKKLEQIGSVYRFSISGRELICSFKKDDNSGSIRKIDLNNRTVICEADTNTSQDTFVYFNNLILTKDNRNIGLVIDKSLEIIDVIPEYLRIADNHLINDCISVYQGKIKDRKFGVYSLLDKKILWMDNEQKAFEVFGDKLFGQDNFELYRTDILTGKILWRQKIRSLYPKLLEQKGRINIIGIASSEFIVGIEKQDKLLALDIETGVIKWEIDTFIKGLYVDAEKGLLHQMLGNYSAYEIKTGKLVDNFINDTYFKSMGIESQRSNFALVGDHIITTDWQKGIVGVFNTVTHKFDWVHKEEGVSFPSPNPVVYSDPYLVVHDNKGTLHIFEKE